MNHKTKIQILFITVLVITSIIPIKINSESEPIAGLVLKTYGGGIEPDYALLIAEDLRTLGIEIKIKIEEWSVFVGTLLASFDFDLAITRISYPLSTKTNDYFENDIVKCFGVNTEIPYGNLSANILVNASKELNPLKRQKLIYEFQEYAMDKLLYHLPLGSPLGQISTWSNLQGIEGIITSEGYDREIADLIPNIQFEGLHVGQNSINELRFCSDWHPTGMMNPLELSLCDCGYPMSAGILPLLNMRIIDIDEHYNPTEFSLVQNWEQISDYLFRFKMREDIFWNPSFNITGRNSESPDLDPSDLNQLMTGLKGQYSTGINRRVTAKDVVFTLLTWDNPITTGDRYYRWYEKCYVDPEDEYSFYLKIEEDLESSGYYADVNFFEQLTNTYLLPEFFLNSTRSDVSYTRNGIKCVGLYSGIMATSAWKTYNRGSFGCTKYMLDWYNTNNLVLVANPEWFGYNSKEVVKEGEDIQKIIIYQYYSNNYGDLLQAFIDGELDIFTPQTEDSIFLKNDERFEIYTYLLPYMYILGFNLARPFVGGVDNYVWLTEAGKEEYTQGVTIRKIISYAIDREKIYKELVGETGVITHSVFPAHSIYQYTDDLVKYPKDLCEVGEWILAAGYDIGSDNPFEEYCNLDIKRRNKIFLYTLAGLFGLVIIMTPIYIIFRRKV